MFKKIKQLGNQISYFVYANIFLVKTVFAADDNSPKIPNIPTLPGPKNVERVSEASDYLQQSFLPRIALTVITLAISASVIFLIFGAIQFLTAYGNEEKLGNAKKTLVFALVGLIISIFSYAIVQVIFVTGFRITEVA